MLAPAADQEAERGQAQEGDGGLGDGGETKAVNGEAVVVASIVLFHPPDPECRSHRPIQSGQTATSAGNQSAVFPTTAAPLPVLV